MNTKPPINKDEATSVWTPADELRLLELQERKTRIFAENIQRLADLLDMVVPSVPGRDLANALVPLADPLMKALQPFSTPKP